MDFERWRLLSPYLDRALELGGEDLAPWLDTLRREQPALACDLERLLAVREAIAREGFLEDAALELLRARFHELGLDRDENR